MVWADTEQIKARYDDCMRTDTKFTSSGMLCYAMQQPTFQRNLLIPSSSTLKMEAADSSETLEPID
jgi:hypothetical protein